MGMINHTATNTNKRKRENKRRSKGLNNGSFFFALLLIVITRRWERLISFRKRREKKKNQKSLLLTLHVNLVAISSVSLQVHVSEDGKQIDLERERERGIIHSSNLSRRWFLFKLQGQKRLTGSRAAVDNNTKTITDALFFCHYFGSIQKLTQYLFVPFFSLSKCKLSWISKNEDMCVS